MQLFHDCGTDVQLVAAMGQDYSRRSRSGTCFGTSSQQLMLSKHAPIQ